MFKKKVSEEAVLPVNTLTLVREQSFSMSGEDILHWEKLARVRGDSTFFPPKSMEFFIKRNIRFFVKPSFIFQFRYHATILKDYSVCNIIGNSVIYVGDIPNSVLDKIEEARQVGISHFTIHSNQRFPVECVQIDPVLIAWNSSPFIGPNHIEKRVTG